MTERSNLARKIDALYYSNLAISLGSIFWDLGPQELVREKVSSGEVTLGPVADFLNNNFVGDVGNAFAAVAGVPFVAEVINSGIQKGDFSETTKSASENITKALPFLMFFLFLLASYDAETSQMLIKSGTPTQLDLVGAYYGALVALPTVLKARRAIFRSDTGIKYRYE